MEERVRDLLSRMTVGEKARQLDMYAGPTAERRDVGRAVREMKARGFRPEDGLALWGHLGVGSMHDLHPNAELANTLQQWVMENSRLGIPVIYIEEGLHEFSNGTVFPSPLNLSATFNPGLARRTGAAIAAEARAAGADMLLAPVLDLAVSLKSLAYRAASAVRGSVARAFTAKWPLTIGWAKDHVPAILEAWYPAEFGGTAIAETLFGDNPPAGRLTVTFPRSQGQLPVYYNADPSKIHRYVGEDPSPLFPFGLGLSYTTFEYRNLTAISPKAGGAEDLIVKVDVVNTGDVEADEVAQLYLRKDVSSVETPARALKAFERVHLKPKESRTVTFRVPQAQLEIWNAQQRWVVEPGDYTAWAGGSSAATLRAKFVVTR